MNNNEIIEYLEDRGFKVWDQMYGEIEIWDPCLSPAVATGRTIREAYKNFRNRGTR